MDTLESFRRAWRDVQEGRITPIDKLWDDIIFTPPAIPDPYFPAPVIPPAESPVLVIDLSKVTPGENGEITTTYTISGKLA